MGDTSETHNPLTRGKGNRHGGEGESIQEGCRGGGTFWGGIGAERGGAFYQHSVRLRYPNALGKANEGTTESDGEWSGERRKQGVDVREGRKASQASVSELGGVSWGDLWRGG